MHASTATVETLIDREAIRDVITRVARGEDRRHAGLLKSAFWPDARIDLAVFEGSFDDYFGWVVPGADSILNTLHTLGQSMIALRGDAAKVETHVTSYHRVNTGSEERDTVIGGRYLDTLAKRYGEWRIAARVMLYDWFRDDGVSVDWSQGVMGMPFLAGHYTGRANGDYSGAWFE
jgi:SnoaL-like domain